MFDGEAELGIADTRAWAGRVGLDHHEPAIDLLAPVHPRCILLADKAALGEADSIQLDRVALEPENVAELRPPFGDAQMEAVLEPVGGGFARRRNPAAAELR